MKLTVEREFNWFIGRTAGRILSSISILRAIKSKLREVWTTCRVRRIQISSSAGLVVLKFSLTWREANEIGKRWWNTSDEEKSSCRLLLSHYVSTFWIVVYDETKNAQSVHLRTRETPATSAIQQDPNWDIYHQMYSIRQSKESGVSLRMSV